MLIAMRLRFQPKIWGWVKQLGDYERSKMDEEFLKSTKLDVELIKMQIISNQTEGFDFIARMFQCFVESCPRH